MNSALEVKVLLRQLPDYLNDSLLREMDTDSLSGWQNIVMCAHGPRVYTPLRDIARMLRCGDYSEACEKLHPIVAYFNAVKALESLIPE